MGKRYDRIDDDLAAWLGRQHVFFTATAPGDGGHVNCSPKGLEAFRILDPQTVGYLDYVGSGVETIAHIRDNGRIVLMFCAFEGPPKIVRLHGSGEVVQRGEEGYGGSDRLSVQALILAGGPSKIPGVDERIGTVQPTHQPFELHVSGATTDHP